MATMTKRAKAAAEAVDREKLYGVDEAIKILKDLASKSKFDETIDVAINLGVDPRHADQMVRGVISLPAGTGKDSRVAVFAKDAKGRRSERSRRRHRWCRRPDGSHAGRRSQL